MKRAKTNVILKRLSYSLKQYFSETSLHGFRYITDPKSSRFKSCFWTLVCLTNFCLCFLLIRSQFLSFYSNRITTTILTTAFPIWEVPFPAITLCNFNLVYKPNTKMFVEILEPHFSRDEINNFFSNLSSLIVANTLDKNSKWSSHSRITRMLQRVGYDPEKLMNLLAQPCEKMISECYWNNEEINCSEIFKRSKTNSGFCCSFNYKPNALKEDHLYVSGIGPNFGLSAQLHIEETHYLSSSKHASGIDVSVHGRSQYPDMSIYTTTVRPEIDLSLSIKPEIVESEESVRKTDITTRGCAFPNEVKMEWSSQYSYTTCINACKAKAIKKLCHCIPFYYNPIDDGKTRYCSLADMICIAKNQKKIKKSKITDNGFLKKRKTENNDVSGNSIKCKCLPQCNEISYSYQLNQESLQTAEGIPGNFSMLHVYFGHVSCTKLLRSVLITWEFILASVGGLIGLCLGGSILSIIEFLYHVIEALFSKYPPKPKFKPKLYLKDFAPYHKEILIEAAHLGKSKVNRVKIH